MFLAKTPIQVPEDAELIVTMYHKSRFTDHNVGNFKIHYTENTDVTLDGGSNMPQEVVAALIKGNQYHEAARAKNTR